ncbi:hypothetical protein M569_10834, partial [Genlisea aurea]
MVLGTLKGQPLVTKLSALSQYVVFPGVMIAALIYSPPDYVSSKKKSDPALSTTS